MTEQPNWKALIEQGYGVRETARRVGVDGSTITRRMQKLRVKPAPLNPEEQARISRAQSEAMVKANAIRRQKLADAKLARMAEIQALAESGACTADIARETGLSRAAVWRCCQTMGIAPVAKSTKVTGSIMDVVGDMKPMDALRYVAEAYDELVGRSDEAEFYGLKFNMSQYQCLIFSVLLRRINCVVTGDTLESALDHARDNGRVSNDNLIKVYISKLRAKLKGSPFAIETVWGVGYRLVHNPVTKDSDNATRS